jgi:hypothetical protein
MSRPAKAILARPLVVLFLSSLSALLCAQAPAAPAPGTLSSVGSGTGTTAAEAVEAAKIAAVTSLVRNVLKRDDLFRDLLVPEAIRNDYFAEVKPKEEDKGRWTATATASLDAGVAEALYLGRYSTTAVDLLDQAEAALSKIDPLLDEAAAKEQNGDLGGAETAYRLADGRAAEAARVIGPVDDAFYFSTRGNRKAPELKAAVESARRSAADGLLRIRAGRERLSQDREYLNVIALLDGIDGELAKIESLVDELYPLAEAPGAYATERLRTSRERAERNSETLAARRAFLADRAASLSPEMEYPRSRSEFALDRMDGLERTLSRMTSAFKGELFRRSAGMRTISYVFLHEPTDRFGVGLILPPALSSGTRGPEFGSRPLVFDARAEGAFAIGSGGFWCRTAFEADTEEFLGGGKSSYLSQRVDAGFFGDSLVGVGFRWDWLRGGDVERDYAIRSVSLVLGVPGDGLGAERKVPLWVTALSWEIPGKSETEESLRTLNVAIDSTLRPNRWVRLEAGGASRVRVLEVEGLTYLASARAGIGFRVPPLKPFLWRIVWEGQYRAGVAGDEIDWESAETEHAFRLGFEYTF